MDQGEEEDVLVCSSPAAISAGGETTGWQLKVVSHHYNLMLKENSC